MSKVILRVEDNASDEKLTTLAFKKCGVLNEPPPTPGKNP